MLPSGRYAGARRADEGASDFAPALDPRKVGAIGHPWRLIYARWKPAVQVAPYNTIRCLRLVCVLDTLAAICPVALYPAPVLPTFHA